MLVAASLLLAGCGETRPEAADPEPAPSSSATTGPAPASPSGSRRVVPDEGGSGRDRADEDHPSEPPFGPEGYGRVRLGMSRDDLLAMPGVRLLGGDARCPTFEAPGVSGGLERGAGVVYLEMTADAATPEQVQVGSTYDEVRAAYPGAAGDDAFLTATPAGHDDRYYRFDLDLDGRVSWIVLVSLRQHCVS